MRVFCRLLSLLEGWASFASIEERWRRRMAEDGGGGKMAEDEFLGRARGDCVWMVQVGWEVVEDCDVMATTVGG